MDERLERAEAALSTDPASTLLLAEEAARTLTSPEERETVVIAHRVRGQAFRALGRHAEAVEAFAVAAELARILGNTRLAAQVRVGSVDSLGMLGRYAEAVQLARELERDLRASGAEEAAAKVLFNLGALHYRRDSYADALECFQQAGVIFAQSPHAAALLPHVQTNTALVLTFLDRTEEAIALYREAQVGFLATEQTLEAATVDANLGFVHSISGRYAVALAALNRARQTFAGQGRLHEAARYAIDAGDAYRALNLLPEARTCYDEALAIFAELPLPYDEARARMGRATTFLLSETESDFRPQAEADLGQAEVIFRQQRNGPQRAHLQLIRAGLATRLGHFTEAHALSEAAMRTFRRSGLTGWMAEAMFVAANAELYMGERPIRRLHRIARVARSVGRGWLECRAQHALGRAYHAAGQAGDALRYWRLAVQLLDSVRTQIALEEFHISFMRDKIAIQEDLIVALLERGRPQDIRDALSEIERAKSRLLLERILSALPEETNILPPDLQSRLNTLRAQLSRAYHREVTFGDDETRRLTVQDATQLRETESAYRNLLREADLHQEAPSALTSESPTRVETLCATLTPDERLVEYYIVRGEVCAFVLSPKGIHYHACLGSVANLETHLRRFRFYLSDVGAYDDDNLSPEVKGTGILSPLKRLYDLLWRPLEPWLDAEKVIVIPHGSLHRFPIAGLHDGQQHLIERWQVNYAPSAALWHTLRQRATGVQRGALLMGVPEPGIEQVAREIDEIGALFPEATRFCGHSATLRAFQQHASGKRILHLATHGMFRSDNPLFSGLRFADDWLLARDLYNMRLNAELVTLSACRTGVTDVGAGDELFGLCRGFLAAGARSLAVSLWQADDYATTALMTHFYGRIRTGANPGAALREAQLRVRDTFAHPYYWLPFIVVGAG